jgi:fumarylacetoacetate (FAA) hydrolase
MYQGASDELLGCCDPIVCPNEAWGIDFESEIAVITGDIPMGCSAERALDGIRLVMLANDVSLRELIPAEVAKGFGFLQSKPATAFSPVAVTPDELGEAWQAGRVHLKLETVWNGKRVGLCDAGPEMAFHFGQLIAHAAKTRNLRAGTIVGSGTVSNKEESHGYGCILEKRAIIHIEIKGNGGASIFGAIDQDVTPA